MYYVEWIEPYMPVWVFKGLILTQIQTILTTY